MLLHGLISFGTNPSGTSSSGGGTGSVNKYSASFTNITSGNFSHGFSSRDLIVAVYDNGSPTRPPYEILPDEVILETLDVIGLKFNGPTSGRIVILG